MAVGDVVSQHEVFAVEAVGAVVGVDAGGHVVELRGAGDDVGVGLGAAAAPGQGDGDAAELLVTVGAGEGVAGQVGDGAAEATGDKRRAEGGGDGAAEGEHVRAAAAEVVVVAPVGVKVRRAAHGDNLAEGNGDIDGSACAVRAGSHHGVARLGGGGGVAEGHANEEVLVAPSVVVVAAGVEAGGDVPCGDGQDDGAAAVVGPVVVVLEFILVLHAVAVAELAVAGEAVGEEDFSLGVAAVGELETDLIDGVRGVVDRAVGVGARVVAGAAAAGDNLEVLVAVVLLPLGEADGGVNLVAERVEVGGRGAGAADERAGAHGGGLLRVVVFVIDEDVAQEVVLVRRFHVAGGRRVGDVEVLAAAHVAGEVAAAHLHEVTDALAHLVAAELRQAAADAAVFVGDEVAAEVRHLEAVGAAAGGLVLVGVRRGRLLRDGDGLAGLVGGEGQRAGGGGEVLPLDGAEGDGAVVDRLADGGVATAGNRKGAAAVGHGEGGGGPRTTLPRRYCHYRQHQCEDLVHDSGSLT